jgi:hypothetical protein
MATFTGMDYYLNLPIEDLFEIAEEVKAVNAKDG